MINCIFFSVDMALEIFRYFLQIKKLSHSETLKILSCFAQMVSAVFVESFMKVGAVKMPNSGTMLKKFKEVSDSAYNLEKALNFADLTKNDLESLKEKVLKVESIPKSILDHQVGFANFR